MQVVPRNARSGVKRLLKLHIMLLALGALDLWLESPNQGATVLSEVWLIRK